MAKIIDKDEKRCDIARASIELFCDKGIAQTSIDEIAKSAGVAKGTIYLYFKNKEEIILTIWEMLVKEHHEIFQSQITESMSAKEKILRLFDFSECTHEHDKEQILTLYQNLISTMLTDKTGLYTNYCKGLYHNDYEIIASCLHQGIEKKELIPCDVDKLTNAIIICMEGIVIQSKMHQLTFQETQVMLTRYITFLLTQHERKDA